MDKQKRIEIVNSLIKYIAENDEKKRKDSGLLHYKDNVAYFKHDGKTLYFIDHYTNVAMSMNRSSRVTKVQEYNFSSGGTMLGLIKDFTHFIYGNDNSNGLNGYGGLYCTHWGWSEEGMEKMREYAREIGYLKS
ncbi:hypothetical protein AB1I92_07720 [Bacillus mobilis]|uniref:Uncharacterized protein n=2 Tax=Bacillus cereus group TaxID=86661 RepID=A0A1C4C9V9_BACCE|nr:MULTISPECIES: hypothetical protein [Bacillus cereus group]OKA34394.1 hypothetical protein BJR07_23015 [Bacillus cereus]OKA38163.1 hypothetical protein BJR06_12005 [Bacillus cereus]SCC15822.1 Uncharacterized protein BC0861_02295 [Bacillus mobilis]